MLKIVGTLIVAWALVSIGACVVVVDGGEGEVDATWASEYQSTPEDESLAQDIGDGFDADPALRTEDLRVSVRRGVATLRGEVSNLAALERAMDVASSVEGVRRVVSKLTVEVSAS